MNQTYLIQRLNESTKNPFSSFGGGLINGGLSDEAMELLSPIFSFDYMGSAEFEHGAVADTLSHIFNKNNNYKSEEIIIDKKSVYVFAKLEHFESMRKLLTDLYHNKLKTRERTNFKNSLSGDGITIGWLELNNNFFFFKDKDAFDQLVKLNLDFSGKK